MGTWLLAPGGAQVYTVERPVVRVTNPLFSNRTMSHQAGSRRTPRKGHETEVDWKERADMLSTENANLREQLRNLEKRLEAEEEELKKLSERVLAAEGFVKKADIYLGSLEKQRIENLRTEMEASLVAVVENFEGQVKVIETLVQDKIEDQQKALEMTRQHVQSYKEIVEKRVDRSERANDGQQGRAEERRNLPIHLRDTCVVKAPKGFISGRHATARAVSLSESLVSKLELPPGHMTRPEAISVVQLRTKATLDHELWLVRFSHAREVQKFMAYRPQLARAFKSVYIRPDYTAEEREVRDKLYQQAKAALAKKGDSADWRIRWVDHQHVALVHNDSKRVEAVERAE